MAGNQRLIQSSQVERGRRSQLPSCWNLICLPLYLTVCHWLEMSLKGRNWQAVLRTGFNTGSPGKKKNLRTGNCLPGVLISALLNIWLLRLRWQQTIYCCLLYWCRSQCCTGCSLFIICGSGVLTYWLDSQKAAVCTRKFESKMALKWSHPGLG